MREMSIYRSSYRQAQNAGCHIQTDSCSPDFSLSGKGIAELPAVMRLIHFTHHETDTGLVLNDAIVYFADTTLAVVWHSETVDDRLRRGYLIKLAADEPVCLPNGKILIERLCLAETALRSVNLFLTVPPGWLSDRVLLARAARLWERLERNDAEIFNEALWDSRRLYQYLTEDAMSVRHAKFRECVWRAQCASQLHEPDAASATIAEALLAPVSDHVLGRIV